MRIGSFKYTENQFDDYLKKSNSYLRSSIYKSTLMKRRNFVRTVVSGTAALQVFPFSMKGQGRGSASVRLGGPLFDPYQGPEDWTIEESRVQGSLLSGQARYG